MGNAYEIRYGKFGAYFYDIELQKDMTLQEVLDVLNSPPTVIAEERG